MENTERLPKVVSRKCILCKTEHSIETTEKDFVDWINGKPIQAAMPYLTPDQRELFISGICGKCFDERFPEPVSKKS